MPKIAKRRRYNAFKAEIERLALTPLVQEAEAAVTGFELTVATGSGSNEDDHLREGVEQGFAATSGWRKSATEGSQEWPAVGGSYWSKALGPGRKLGVAVHVSGSYDLLHAAVLRLKDELGGRSLSAGIIIVPDDYLSELVDGIWNPCFTLAHIFLKLFAPDIPVLVIGLRHDRIWP